MPGLDAGWRTSDFKKWWNEFQLREEVKDAIWAKHGVRYNNKQTTFSMFWKDELVWVSFWTRHLDLDL